MTKYVDITRLHSGKWYEVVVYAKEVDDPGEVIAKFISMNDAYIYAISLANKNIYYSIVLR